MILFVMLGVVALLLNVIAILLKLNYLASVLLAMGGVSLVAVWFSRKELTHVDYLSMLVFVTLSNVTTTVIEKLMIVFDVWGFSNAHAGLLGWSFWGAPIEEYIYWWMAPVVVVTTYLSALKTPWVKFSKVADLPLWLDISLITSILKFESERTESEAEKTSDVYLENQNSGKGVDVSGSKYKRGSKVPVWAMVVLFVLTCMAVGYIFFRGAWRAVLGTALVFLCVAYPNELYSLSRGYWVYNNSKMIGIWVLGVPVEEWFMYTASPVAGSMLFSIYRNKVHKLPEV